MEVVFNLRVLHKESNIKVSGKRWSSFPKWPPAAFIAKVNCSSLADPALLEQCAPEAKGSNEMAPTRCVEEGKPNSTLGDSKLWGGFDKAEARSKRGD